MKKNLLIISFTILGLYVYPSVAEVDTSNIIYVSPDVAREAIEKHFSNVVSANANDFTSETDDTTVLNNVIDAYNEMLQQNDGFVSVDGVKHVCDIAFSDLKAKSTENMGYSFENECMNFAIDLVTEQNESNNNCPYTITKVNDSQMRIKYQKKDGSGFIRNGGTIPWRFLNPGALRGSSLACGTLSTKPNGRFAVFESAEIGKKALHVLLSTNDGYKGKTIAQAIRIYAPSHENNTTKYINDLKNKGINVNKVLPNLTKEEWDNLENAITTLEGWNVKGTVEHF